MPVPIDQSVVVLTGATSGIGRAAALRFASRGARISLVARDPAELERLADECRGLGGEAITVSADVAVEEQVEEAARATEERFGGIDTWVNSAGLMAYGTFEQIPSAAFRRVVEVNLMGQVHGARAALPRLRRRGGGVIVNMSSVWGRVTTPYASPYIVSKHGARAFAECLHQELIDDDTISVSTMLPQSVDTPIFRDAANYGGLDVVPIPPISTADEIAEGIVKCAENPKREVSWGWLGRGLMTTYALAPWLYHRVAPGAFMAGSFPGERAQPDDGNLFEPNASGSASGGWRSDRRGDLVRAFVRAGYGSLAGLLGQAERTKPTVRPPPD